MKCKNLLKCLLLFVLASAVFCGIFAGGVYLAEAADLNVFIAIPLIGIIYFFIAWRGEIAGLAWLNVSKTAYNISVFVCPTVASLILLFLGYIPDFHKSNEELFLFLAMAVPALVICLTALGIKLLICKLKKK